MMMLQASDCLDLIRVIFLVLILYYNNMYQNDPDW